MRIGLLSPVWFPVPPTGYGGIEWVVALLADGLVDAGHDVTLFASGDSQTKAELVSVFDVAPSERDRAPLPELYHALACYERAERVRRRQRPLGPPGRSARRHGQHARRPHRARAARRRGRADLRADRAGLPRRRAHLAVAEPAPAEARSPVDRELPERARPQRLSRAPASRRLPPVPRAALRGQGRAPRDRGRAGGRAAAQDRRQDARADSRRSTSRRTSGRISAGGSSTWARSRTRRRSTSSRTPA